MSRVPVDKLRAEVDAAGLDAYELAALLGWRDRRGWIDTERVQRMLGERSYSRGGTTASMRRGVNWSTAERVRAAIAAAQTHPGRDTDATAPKGEERPGPRQEGSSFSAPEPDRRHTIPPPQNTSPDPPAPCGKNIRPSGETGRSSD